MAKEKQCSICNKTFHFPYKNGMVKFCTDECRSVARAATQKKLRAKRKIRAIKEPMFLANEVYLKYKQRAPRRNLDFTLSKQDFIDAAIKPCNYCGQDYEGLGFDRVDNSIGYHKDNVVPCCTMCNMMKRHYSYEELITHCKKLISNCITQPMAYVNSSQ